MTIKIKGHAQQIATLGRQVRLNRLPNAYLFAGPGAIGKKLVAKLLSMELACLSNEPRPFGGCGECVGCKKVSGDIHPDRFYIEADGQQIKIDQIRELAQSLHFHPLESRKKIALIDDADKMNESAANSMLKILEEPPSNTHFILITASPHILLPTIRSRCQKVYFQPLKDDEVADLLLENGASPKEARRIARFSGGSPGIALTLDPAFVDEIIGRFIALCANASSADVIETAGAWAGEDLPKILLILDILASWHRDVLRLQVTGNSNDIIHPEIGRFASKDGLRPPEKGIGDIEMARRSIHINANKQLMFENLLFTLTA